MNPISEQFEKYRHCSMHHLGMGDIRLSVGEQEEIARMIGWQPIETAPKDGTKILACESRGYRPTTVSWSTYHPNAKGKATWRDSEIGGRKMDRITHWMPLPEPPQ